MPCEAIVSEPETECRVSRFFVRATLRARARKGVFDIWGGAMALPVWGTGHQALATFGPFLDPIRGDRPRCI